MTENEIKKIINDTVNATVLKLKMTGLLNNNRKTAFQKTEELLRNYNVFKTVTDQEYTRKIVNKIDEAIEEIKDDIYFDIIPMTYFDDCSREVIAEHFNTSVKTISRNKIRLINKLKLKLFSDDVIFEIFL